MNYQDKSREELISELQNQILETNTLKVLYNNEINNRNNIEHVLNERQKELNCHNRLSEILNSPNLSVDEVCLRILEILPPSWQFPEIAEASIRIPDQVFSTPGYKLCKNLMIQDIKVNQIIVGQIEVCYPVDQVPDVDQLFLPEESSLLFSIAVKLGNYMEKKDNELELKASNEKYANLLENINDVIYVTDNQANITFISPSITKLLGYLPAEIIGQNFSHFVGASREHLQNRFKEIQKSFELQNEYLISSRTGEPHWIRFSSQAIIKEGEFIGVTGTLIDVTETKRVELELQKSESLYRSILTASPDTIFISDLKGNVLFTSPMALKMFGFEEVGFPLNSPLFDFVDPKDHVKAKDAIRQMVEGIYTGATEYVGIKADGSTFDMEVNGEFIRDTEGNPTSMVFVVRDISDRKTAEKKLLKSEEKYRTLVESINDVIYEIDATGNIRFASPSVINILGYTVDEVINRNIFEFIFPEDVPTIMNSLKSLASRDYSFMEYRYVRKDGSMRWVRSSTTANIKDGVMVGATGTLTDVTDRRTAEEKLRKSEETYRHLVETIGEVIYEITTDGTVKYVSPAILKITGYTPEELTGTSFFRIVYPVDMPELLARMSSMDLNNPAPLDLRFVCKDGEIRWVRSLPSKLIENGVVVGRSGVLSDITLQKIAEIELKKSEESFRSIVETLNDVVYEVTSQGIVNYVSPSIKRFLGYDPEELIGQNFFKYMHPEDKPLIIERLANLNNRDYSFMEYRYFAKDGTICWVRSSTNPIIENGEMIGGRGVLIDITERKKAEDALKQSEERLKYLISSQTNYVLWTDLEGRHIYWNQKFEEEYGWMYAEEGLDGAYSLKSICEHHHQRTVETVTRCISNPGEIIKIELDKQAKDGSIRTTLWEFVCLSDANGPIAIQCMGIDITERTEAENKLKESEDRFRTVFENVFDGISIFEEDEDPNKRRLIDCNEQYAVMAGRSREELLQMKYTYQLTETLEYNANDERIKSLAQNNAYHGSFKWIRPDGKDNIIEYIGRPITWHGKSYSIGIDRDITENKRKEDQLRKLSQAIEQSPISIVITDLDGNIEYANPKASETTGYSFDELKGKNPRVLKSGETPQNEYQFLWNSISNGNIWKGIFHNKRKNGELYWESSQITPITNANGKIINYLALKEDITERKKTQEDLFESESRFREITEQSQNVIWETNSEAVYTFVSPAAELAWGLKPSDLIGKKRFFDIHPEEGRQEFMEACLKQVQNGEQFRNLESLVQGNDGKNNWVVTNGMPYYDSEGNVKGYRGSSVNINLQKQAFIELRESEGRYKSIFRDSKSIMLIVDPENGFIVDANEKAASFYGWTLEELRQKRLADIDTITNSEARAKIQKTLAGNQKEFIIKHRLANGSTRDVEVFAGPISIGEKKYLFEIIHDVTERRLAEEALLQRERDLNFSQEIAGMGSWQINMATNTSKWSDNMYRIFGLDPEKDKASQDLFFGLIHPDDRHLIDENLEKILCDRKQVTFEMRINLKSGKTIWIQNSMIPGFDGDQLVTLNGTNVDITYKKLTEEALRINEAALNQAQEISKMSSWELNLVTEKLTWSKNYYQMMGIPLGTEMKSEFFVERVHPDDRHLIDKYYNILKQTKKAVTYDIRLQLKNDEYKWIQNNIIPVLEDDQLVAVKGVNIDVTEKKIDEEKIKQQNERLAAIINALPDIIFISDREGTYLEYYNANSQNMLYDEHKLIGASVRDVFDEKTANLHISKIHECLQEQQLITYEYSSSNTGSIQYFEARIVPLGKDKVLRFVRDFTDKKLKENELIKLSQAVVQSPVSIVITDLDAKVVYVNPAFETTSGYTSAEVLGKSTNLLKSGKTDQRVYQELWDTIVQGKEWKGEWINKKKNGEFYWEDISITPIHNSSGEVTNYLAVKQDITQRKQTEDILRQNEEKYRFMFMNNPQPMWIYDMETLQFLEVNSAAITHYGYSRDEFLMMTLKDIRPQEDIEALIQDVNSSTEALSSPKEWRHRKKSGEIITVEIGSHLITYNNRDARHVLVNDITQRNQIEHEIMELNSSLETRIEERTSELADTNLSLIKEIEVRKLTEKALAESEKSYRTVVENVNEVIFQTDADGLWVFLNKSWEAVTGFSVKESLGQLFVNYVHPDDRVRNWELFEPLIQRKKDYCRHQVRYLTKDGGFRWVEVFARLGLNENDEITGTYGTLMDITDRKIAEELMMQTQQNYETFFNTIDDFLFIFQEDGNIVDVNKTVIDRLEYQTEEIINQSVLIVRPTDRWEEALGVMNDILQDKVSYCSIPLLTKSGTQIPVETRLKRGFWNGKPVIFGVSKDISQIKISEEKFSSAFHSNSAIMTISRFDNNQFVDVNNAFINLLGYSREEIVGKTLITLGIIRDITTEGTIQDLINNGIPVKEMEINAYSKSNEIFTFLLSAEEIFVGLDRCILSIAVNITERKIMENELRKAREEAEQANMAKSEFLSRMSHELRTPMNSILGFAQLLEMGELNARQSKGVNHIMKSGKHLLDLINEVLDISRIEAGRLSLSLEPVQLSGVIPEMIDIVKPQIIERQIWIELLKSESNQMFVRSDRQRLKQILLNLLNNAIKYNRESGSIWIKTELRPLNEAGTAMIRISITDTGMGISEEDLPKLFNPFERIGAEKSATEGTGLGLSVVKKLVDAMAGKLGVESKIGAGSTFWIELPFSESPLDHAEKSGALMELEPNLNSLSGTILYIEDNASNIELVEQILTNQRSRIKLISNMTGAETVQMAIAYRPDLILLDLNLPDLHGSKVLSLLLAEKQTKNIPVVVISADAMPQQLELLLKGGARDYLTKPLDVQEFLMMIDKYIPHQME